MALADYSGKQKVVTKFSKATVVVTLRDAPHNALKGIEVSSPLLIVQSAKEGMGTQKQKLYILKKDTDVSSLEKNTTLEVSSEDDLRNKNNMESSQIIFVDKGLELSQAVSVIVDKVLSRLR
ncbi:MAG: hypothetical protein GKR87_02255 [Kiritimatiellae bacterium]|nr:hypothetical protein [Kiritimatiellia bacterium]